MSRSFQLRRPDESAFTLIELLIVIAIIAVLALIAVPNFLEAQVRSKVSRAQADMRSLGTAIEAYSVDFGRPPLSVGELRSSANTSKRCVADTRYTNDAALARTMLYASMTTPVSFVSSWPIDPFRRSKGQEEPYDYQTFVCEYLWNPGSNNHFEHINFKGYTWALGSQGPAMQGGWEPRVLCGHHQSETDIPYDPTNGTMSVGCVVRTNKGAFQGQPGS